MTPAALMRANVLYANGLLRKLGARPSVQMAPHPLALGKIALARAAKTSGLVKVLEKSIEPTFTLEQAATDAA
jgi:hypothetical protein